MRCGILLVVALVGCGDNVEPGEECQPPQGDLPTVGAYVDPYAIELPTDCVEGGLRALPGRWFVRIPERFFNFEYPLYDGTCTSGFKRRGTIDDDHDDTDRFQSTYHTWTDGTRYFERTRQVFGAGTENEYEYIGGSVTCMRPDDTLAVTDFRYDSENGDRILFGTGARFGLKDELASNMELVGEVGPQAGGQEIYALNVVVDGDYAFVVGTRGFDSIDVSDPANPVHLDHIDGRLNDVRIVHGDGKTVAFAASEGGDDRVWVIDVSNPADVQFVSVIDEYAHSVQTRTVGGQTELFLANYSSGVPRYDVTSPLSPVKTGIAMLPGQTLSGVHDLTVYGDRIYANNTDAGFVAVDTSANFTLPTELGRISTAYSHASWAGQINGQEIVLHGDEGMNFGEEGGAFMRVLDGNPDSPTYMQDIGKYQSRKEVGIHNIEVHGTRAYIAYYQDGVRIVDLADPTNPVEVAHYNTWDPAEGYGDAFEGAVGVRKVGDYIYVADLSRGLIILRETL